MVNFGILSKKNLSIAEAKITAKFGAF